MKIKSVSPTKKKINILLHTLIYLAPMSRSQFPLSLAFLWHTFFHLESLVAISSFFRKKWNQFLLLLAYVLNNWGASEKVNLFLFSIWWILCFYRFQHCCLHIAFCWYTLMVWCVAPSPNVSFFTGPSFLTGYCLYTWLIRNPAELSFHVHDGVCIHILLYVSNDRLVHLIMVHVFEYTPVMHVF